MNAKLFSISLLTAGVLLASASPASASGYKFTDLGTLGGGGSSVAMGINNSGQVVGESNGHAVIWNGTTPTDLGVGGGYGINNSGQVVGYSNTSGKNSTMHATIWNGTTPTDLSIVGRESFSWASGINDSGQVVGLSIFNSGLGGMSASRTVIWNGTTPTDLSTLGGLGSQPSGINNSGQVVGWSTTSDGTSHATIWNGTTPTDLGTLGGLGSVATGINDSGQVVGYSTTLGDPWATHATIWNGTTPTDLGIVGGAGVSWATAINNSGQVVGVSRGLGPFISPHATLWDGTALHTPTDLNNLLSVSAVNAGWELIYAFGINDNGWIVGLARTNGANVYHAYLLTPCDICPITIDPINIDIAQVPEPETYAMFMAGLGLMGFIARRRKNDQA
ncbi:MAG: DUF3466 family protein [Nitrosospira sp.]|nr:DUF3466 family protein [Nitrosospira sp.]